MAMTDEQKAVEVARTAGRNDGLLIAASTLKAYAQNVETRGSTVTAVDALRSTAKILESMVLEVD